MDEQFTAEQGVSIERRFGQAANDDKSQDGHGQAMGVFRGAQRQIAQHK